MEFVFFKRRREGGGLNFQDAVENLTLKFKSGNSVEVPSARITKEEWNIIKNFLQEEAYRQKEISRITSGIEKE